jgi:YegS/Rv2252/BmrU family lipid kinase
MPTTKKIHFLIKPGGSIPYPKLVHLIQASFREPDWDSRITILQNWNQVGELSREAARQGIHALVAAGGDGTINGCLAALAGTRTRLGILPNGTGNGFARGMGIPLKPEQALDAIRAGHEKQVDLGLANGKTYFANILGIGFDAAIARTANQIPWLARANKLARYLLSGMVEAVRFRSPVLKVESNGQVSKKKVFLLAVANTGQYGMDFTIAPGADPGDGHMNLALVQPLWPWQLVQNFFRGFKARPMIGTSYLQSSRLRVEAVPHQDCLFHTDGEPAGSLPVEIKVHRKALRVLVPQKS